MSVKITWKDNDGSVKARGTTKSNTSGQFRYCRLDQGIEAGDVLTGKVGTIARSLTIPRLSIRADRPQDHIVDRAPADSTVTVGVQYWMGINPQQHRTMQVPGDGTFDVLTDGFAGGDDAFVRWRSNATSNAHRVTRWLTVPFVAVWVNRNFFYGSGRPGHKALVGMVPSGSDVPLGDATVAPRPWGSFVGDFLDDDGHLVRVRAGQEIRAFDVAANAYFGVLAVTAFANPSTDRVTGNCGSNSMLHYYIEAYSPSGSRYGLAVGVTGSSSAFSKDLTSRLDLRSGDTVNVQRRLGSGDQVGKMFIVP
ncbi:MAG: hypothetical protein LH650_08590 [Chloroflexi bacterium]|nr:hypothetical protein [Chloroflexota bacterium]